MGVAGAALTLLFLNWGEHRIHQGLGHHKRRLGAMFYKRHTGDHHSFFEERHMPFEQARDWRVILFPAWLVLVQSAGAVVLWAVIRPFNPELAAVVGAGWVLGYLLYEVLHACEHLPDSNPVARLPWVRHMRHLHALHHRRDLMQERNMNIVFPLTDWLYGTPHWEPMPEAGLVRQQHVVDLSGTPEAVLDYARDASHWPEWHPSSKAIYGVSGPLPAARPSRRTSNPPAASAISPGASPTTSRAGCGPPRRRTPRGASGCGSPTCARRWPAAPASSGAWNTG